LIYPQPIQLEGLRQQQQQQAEMNPPNPPLVGTDLVVAAQMQMMQQMADTMVDMHAQM
jgi:hypothetical protein